MSGALNRNSQFGKGRQEEGGQKRKRPKLEPPAADYIDAACLQEEINKLKEELKISFKEQRKLINTKVICETRLNDIIAASQRGEGHQQFEKTSWGQMCLKLSVEEKKRLKQNPLGGLSLSLTAPAMLELRQRLERSKKVLQARKAEVAKRDAQLSRLGTVSMRQPVLSTSLLPFLPIVLIDIIRQYDQSSGYSKEQSEKNLNCKKSNLR